MKPYIHARISAKKFGGVAEDYLAIHDFMDSTKASHPDVRHRAILHNSFGCFLAEKIFGHNIINADGKEVSVRDVAEAHVIEDLGYIPTLTDWLSEMPVQPWMGGANSEHIRRKMNVEGNKEEQVSDSKTETIKPDIGAPLNPSVPRFEPIVDWNSVLDNYRRRQDPVLPLSTTVIMD